MPGGGGGLGFGAGFARGFSNALLSKRERERKTAADEAARKDRLFGTLLPTMIDNAESWSDVEAAIIAQYPEMAGGKGKKATETPLSKIGKFLAPFIGLKQKPPVIDESGAFPSRQPNGGAIRLGGTLPPSRQPTGVTGGTLNGIPPAALAAPPAAIETPAPPTMLSSPVDMPAGDAPFGMQAGDHILPPSFPPPTQPGLTETGGTPQAQGPSANQPANQPTLFGVRMLTPEQKAQRQTQTAVAAAEAQIAARRKIAREMGLTPEQTLTYSLTGELPGGAKAPEGFTLNPNDIRFDASGKEIARNTLTPPSANQINTFDEALLAAQNDPVKTKALLDLQKRSAEAKRAPESAAADDTTGIAAMAADNPAMLQGLTPTVTGDVLKAIAKSPALRQRFEQARMAPVRAQTEEIVNTMKRLFVLDKDGNIAVDKAGKPIGLSEGAKTLYGKSQYFGSQFIAGTDAANAKAALAQVTAGQALELIAQLKAQSKTGATGFGQLNLRELALLESAASVLKGNISEDLALEKLQSIYEKFRKILAPSAQEAMDAKRPAAGGGGASKPSGAGTGLFMDGAGNLVDGAGNILAPAG